MKPLRYLAVTSVVLALSAAAVAQTRGMGRIFGSVKDANGQPIADAQIKAVKVDDLHPLTTRTNKKGEWAIAGIAPGRWNIDVMKDGYQTKSITVDVRELERLPSIDLALTAAKPKVDPNAEIAGQLQKGDALFTQKQYADARKVYEDLLAKYPEAWQIELRIARSYAAEGQPDKALAHLQAAQAKQPDNVEVKLLVAAELMDLKKTDEARALLASIDMSKVKDPVVFINAGISLINEGKAADAKAMFDQVVQHFPTNPDGYYYRARAYLTMSSFPEAKADLEKFVAMPGVDATELADAKKILAQLK